MKKLTIMVFAVLVSASTTFAATISDASLKGTYTLQLSSPEYNSWGENLNCGTNGNTYTLTAGGNTVNTEHIAGTVTFDGKGNVTGSFSQYGRFDQAASNATVVASCSQGVVNNGNAVYDPVGMGTFTGTYSVQSSGIGTMDLSISNGNVSTMVLQVAGTTAVRTTVFLFQYDSNNRVEASGSAVLQ